MSKKLVFLKMRKRLLYPAKKGAYTRSIGIGSIQIQILKPYPKELLLLAGSLSRSVQTDIVKVHLARAAGDCRVALGSQTNSDPVNV